MDNLLERIFESDTASGVIPRLFHNAPLRSRISLLRWAHVIGIDLMFTRTTTSELIPRLVKFVLGTGNVMTLTAEVAEIMSDVTTPDLTSTDFKADRDAGLTHAIDTFLDDDVLTFAVKKHIFAHEGAVETWAKFQKLAMADPEAPTTPRKRASAAAPSTPGTPRKRPAKRRSPEHELTHAVRDRVESWLRSPHIIWVYDIEAEFPQHASFAFLPEPTPFVIAIIHLLLHTDSLHLLTRAVGKIEDAPWPIIGSREFFAQAQRLFFTQSDKPDHFTHVDTFGDSPLRTWYRLCLVFFRGAEPWVDVDPFVEALNSRNLLLDSADFPADLIGTLNSEFDTTSDTPSDIDVGTTTAEKIRVLQDLLRDDSEDDAPRHCLIVTQDEIEARRTISRGQRDHNMAMIDAAVRLHIQSAINIHFPVLSRLHYVREQFIQTAATAENADERARHRAALHSAKYAIETAHSVALDTALAFKAKLALPRIAIAWRCFDVDEFAQAAADAHTEPFRKVLDTLRFAIAEYDASIDAIAPLARSASVAKSSPLARSASVAKSASVSKSSLARSSLARSACVGSRSVKLKTKSSPKSSPKTKSTPE